MAIGRTSIAGAVTAARRHSVLAYFVLAFCVSWGGIVTIVLPGGLQKTSAELDALSGPVFGVMLLGPSLAALVLTMALDGRGGMRTLFVRFARWRVAGRYYLLALLTTPVIAMLVLGMFSASSPVFTPTILGPAGGIGLLATGIVVGLVAGFLEELGWTGFAARRLLSTYGIVATAVLIGVPHGLWHLLVAYYWGNGGSFGLLFIPYFVIAWVVTLTALRLLIVWLYRRTGSALIAGLTHASYTGALVVLWPAKTSPAETMVWTAVFALVLLLAAAALTVSSPRPVTVNPI
jgi:uncharacterized protein